jgi:5-methylcytosine-specific restriction enzyme subunit McrC
MPPAIELIEYRDSSPLDLSPEELAALGKLLPGLTAKPAADGGFVLNPGGVVGVGQVGDQRITVQPKVGIARLMFLIGYSLDSVRWEETFPNLDEAPDVLEAIVPAFVAGVRHATARGILRGYKERTEGLSTIRGRIEVDPLIKKRYGRFPPIDCRFDDYTADIEMNRLLLAASERLLALPGLGSSSITSLRSVRALLGEVSHVLYARRAVPIVHYTRLTAHYRIAVELSRLILRGLTVELGPPGVRARGFFLNLADVFEDFLVVALRQALGVSERSFPQGAQGRALRLDRGGRIRLQPDFSWWDSGRCVFVGDAKYKRTPASTGVKHPDLYQLFSYAQAADLQTALLVYAAGESEPARYHIVHSETLLEVRTLQLTQAPSKLLDEVAEIAEWIRERAAPVLRPQLAVA